MSVMSDRPNARVLIVAEHASARFGGEAILPLHYFQILRRRGIETWMIVHERTRNELQSLLGGDISRVYFLPDRWYHRLLYRVGRPLPRPLQVFGTGFLSRLSTQVEAKRASRRLIKTHQIDVVHQPMPVSPRETSILYDLGAPVVIGPMNGAMRYPPAFAHMDGRGTRLFVAIGRVVSNLLQRLMPGKPRAAVLLAANQRTLAALPRQTRGGTARILVENGVDMNLWQPADHSAHNPVRFLFCGRFEDWKGIDLLLEAFAASVAAAPPSPMELVLVGDGALRPKYEALAQRLNIADHVRFRGWMPQDKCAAEMRRADALVLPSLYECGGAVVLEAMACALPVIATNWGGPADYVTPQCGILIDPIARPAFIAALSDAMTRLLHQPQLRRQLGMAARQRIQEQFDWERKIDAILDVYAEAICRYNGGVARP